MNLDLYIFNFINGFAGKWKPLDFLGVFFAKYLAYFLIVFLFAFSYFTKNMEMFFVPVLSALFARFVINEAIYFFYKRKRPLEVLNIKPLIENPNYPSFPSGHASAFFALSLTLLVYSVPLALFFLIAACLMVFSRIFSGLHWPSDILEGLLVGFLSFLIVIIFA